ncbi:hypothetical protein ABZ297_43390 [Nonomuraea sp. NPDC005983]|uniref:hypothetical protein n=1 Tax=Nonomuraea sp. NPDC005983 TaxID=3155595 RepID=UPI0033BA1E98
MNHPLACPHVPATPAERLEYEPRVPVSDGTLFGQAGENRGRTFATSAPITAEILDRVSRMTC